ncbi:unnamed protein product [Macrosiphum euphorbiae]|uniref:Uncharacterized protein n=1 Tax=Macrosiphum euphorbiae TaxID=13131 RepID=A0AAV0VW17_9HEMI|nr:unnamed protein product [Macrosiphum euphorbiae]CAI6377245.1 unnamed protein product [Macrosiphum euphorbiae]
MDCNFDRRGLKIDNITKVLIALRFYASGNDQRVNGDTLGYSQASVSIVVKEVSGLQAKCGKNGFGFHQIYKTLRNNFI